MFHRKILPSKYPSFTNKFENCGYITPLLNSKNEYIITGDFYHLKDTRYYGPVFFNKWQNCFGLFLGYNGDNIYNPNYYGKFIRIPYDQGMKNELIKISEKDYLNIIFHNKK